MQMHQPTPTYCASTANSTSLHDEVDRICDCQQVDEGEEPDYKKRAEVNQTSQSKDIQSAASRNVSSAANIMKGLQHQRILNDQQPKCCQSQNLGRKSVMWATASAI